VSKYYIAVLVPRREGGWRAHFPDFPGCRAEGPRIEGVIERAGNLVSTMIEGLRKGNAPIPEPRNLEAIRTDEQWAIDRAIDWSKAVVGIVAISKASLASPDRTGWIADGSPSPTGTETDLARHHEEQPRGPATQFAADYSTAVGARTLTSRTRIAFARRLAIIMHAMLRHGTEFRAA
jgi:predicted RNase H-like HicB family nuclease